MAKYINLQVQEAQLISIRINTKKSISRKIIIKCLKIEDQKSLKSSKREMIYYL